MYQVETAQRGGTPRWENGTNVNNIMDEQDEMEDDLENNSAKLFERSRIKALAGLQYISIVSGLCFCAGWLSGCLKAILFIICFFQY